MASIERRPKMDDDAIVALINAGIGQSKGYANSKLSKEFERVLRYYDGEYPKKAHQGDSGYVSLDVYNGVEALTAQILDVFSCNTRPAIFEPESEDDAQAAQVRTDYVTDVVFNQNPGYALFHGVIQNGLLYRNSVLQVFWDTKEKTEFYELSNATFEEVGSWLTQHPDAVVVHKTISEDGVTIDRIRVSVKTDASQVRLELVPPEEFGISPLSPSIKAADLVYRRREMTVSELLKSGYDRKAVLELQSDDRVWMSAESERLARFEPTDDILGSSTLYDGSPARRIVIVYECYTELDIDGDAESQLYKVVLAGQTILDMEPVDRKPFITFCPLPRANAFWGHNYAQLLVNYQNAKTYLTRGIINHTLVTNNPRLLVRKGAVMNPRELMENRFGGLVNVSDIQGIMPLPQAGLNPFVFQTIGLLDAQRDSQTGISQLSQGLNPDAISTQNSGDMIHELITVSQVRSKIVARNFAEGFLRDLYTEIYRLVVENEDREKIAKVSGQWQVTNPSDWPEECSMSISFALGYGQQEKEAARWAQLGIALGGVPGLRPQFTPQQQYNIARKSMEAQGIKDVDNYLLPPDKAVQIPPDPLQQAEIAMKQADAAAKQAAAQATQLQAQFQMAEMQSKERIKMAEIALDRSKLDSEIQLKQDQLAHKVAVDAAEIALERQIQAQAQKQSATAVAQPTRS